MKEYGDSTIVKDQQLIFNNKFQTTPKVIIGIKLYNNDKNLVQTDFYVKSTPQTDKCSLNLILIDPPNRLFSLTISLLAIDTTQMPNIYVSELHKIDITNEISFKSILKYQVNKQQQQKRKVALFLNGFKSTKIYESKKKLNIILSSEEMDQESFYVIVNSTEDSMQIQTVYFQYIEYVENSDSNFFVETFEDIEYINDTFKSPKTGKKQYTLSTTNIQNSDAKTVLIGMNAFKFDHSLYQDTRQKIDIIEFTQSKIDFQYVVWDGTTGYGFSSTLFIIGMKTCSDKAQFINQGQCLTSCQQGNETNFYNVKMCCLNPNYIYKQTCIQNKPDFTYCDDKNICVDCKINCEDCTDPKQTVGYQCKKCKSDYYQLEQDCFESKPENAYCDESKRTCISCKDGCQQCTYINGIENYQCQKCNTDYYQLKQDCLKEKPLNGNCNSNKICNLCKIGCLECINENSSNYQCIQCENQLYKFNQQCYNVKPPYAYCDLNKVCQDCQVQNCLDCSDPKSQPQKCIQCQNSFFKLNDKCNELRPVNTYCNENNECKSCGVEGCFACTDPGEQSSFKCQSCQKEYFSYQNQCFKTQPPNTFCESKICKQCINGCTSCSNPDDLHNYQCSACNQDYFFYQNQCFYKDKKPLNTYCNEQTQICEDCTFKGCKSCEEDKIQCKDCLDGLQLDLKKRCICSDQKKYYDVDTQDCSKNCEFPCLQCYESPKNCINCGEGAQLISLGSNRQTCQCQLKDYHFNEQNNCFKCDPSLKPVISKEGQMTCECNQQGFYLSNKLKQCLKCNIRYCKICNTDGESCQQCESGFKHNKSANIGILKQCQFCIGSIYADQSGACQNYLKCKEGCARCLNPTTCDIYEENHVFKDQECHYSCSECLGQGEFECLKCNAPTREFNPLSNSCPCKSGYKNNEYDNEQERKNCIVDKSLVYENSIQSNRQKMMNAVYFLFLPQLFVNIHPFADMFIYSIQILGNSSLLSQERDPLEQLTIFNFFNILYSNEQIKTEEKQFKVLFLSYKTLIDEQISFNVLILAIFYIFGVITSFIALLIRHISQTPQNAFQKLFLWNFQLKIIRISSNYLLLNVVIHFKNISQASIVSNILITALLLIYLFNLFLQFKKSYDKDICNCSYIREHLNQEIPFQKYFWVIIEFQKILSTILMGIISTQFHKYITIIISAILILLFMKYKPGLNLIRDSIFLVLNQLFVISICSVSILTERQYQNNNISSLESLRFIIDLITFVFGLFQYVYTIEYLIRRWRLKRIQKQNIYSDRTQAPIFLQMPDDFSCQNIEDILNNQTMKQIQKLSFISKKKKL